MTQIVINYSLNESPSTEVIRDNNFIFPGLKLSLEHYKLMCAIKSQFYLYES